MRRVSQNEHQRWGAMKRGVYLGIRAGPDRRPRHPGTAGALPNPLWAAFSVAPCHG